MTELEDIRSFVEVIDSGGFNRAARRLGVSKSIVSRRIGRMEADLGARLLNRTTRGISPTEAGLELKVRGERILAALDEAREAVAHQGAGVVGRLRLSVPLSFGVRHVAPVLAELAQRHPALELGDGLLHVGADQISGVDGIVGEPIHQLGEAPIRRALVRPGKGHVAGTRGLHHR